MVKEGNKLPELLIFKDGVTVFHRSYDENQLKDFDLTAGFLQAMLQFSHYEVKDDIETLRLSNSAFYFHSKKEFNFVLREDRNVNVSHEYAPRMLQQLANKFFEQFPNALKWDGNLSTFENFSGVCDQVLQTSPVRKGTPVIFRCSLESLFFAPIFDIAQIPPAMEETVYELQMQLRKFAQSVGMNFFWDRLHEPLLFHLPETHSIAFIFAIHAETILGGTNYLFASVIDENDFDSFYQLSSLMRRKFKRLILRLGDFLAEYEKDPLSSSVRERRPHINEMLHDWADLNQYASSVRASFFEEFLKARITSDTLSEDSIRQHFEELLKRVGNDFDKIVFALLTLQQILFVGQDKKMVERAISALLAFYPHPSVTLWAETASDSLLVGIPPSQVSSYKTAPVVVDLDRGTVVGGYHNEYVAETIQETLVVARDVSVSDARLFFYGKISSFFVLLRLLLDFVPLEKEERLLAIQAYQQGMKPALVQLIVRMARKLDLPLEIVR
jgi:hypothetical protein